MTVARAIEAVLGPDLPIGVRAYDGSRLGPEDPPATLLIRSPALFQRMLTALRDRVPDVRRFDLRRWAEVARLVGRAGRRRLPVPPEEARLRGRRHSKERDAEAIAHHYDVSNAFYRMVLGPSMTYSYTTQNHPEVTLEQAQAAKYELRGSFIDRYVFPDGELHEIGSVVSTIQRSGLEV